MPLRKSSQPPRYTQEHWAQAKAIGAALDEENVRLIAEVVKVLGKEASDGFLTQAQAIEAEGGETVADGTRKRTPGGVFFRLAKEAMTDEQRLRSFPKTWTKDRYSPYPNFDWADWPQIMEVVRAKRGSGRITEVSIELTGRPIKPAEQRRDLVVLKMVQSAQLHNTPPRGIPQPSEKLQNVEYTVLMSLQQWEKVKGVVSDPNDQLVVNGHFAFDPEFNTIVVFTLSVRNKNAPVAEKPAPQRPARGQERGGGGARGGERGPRGGGTGGSYDRDRERPARPPQERPARQPDMDPLLSETERRLLELRRTKDSLERRLSDLGDGPMARMTRQMLEQTVAQIAQLEGED